MSGDFLLQRICSTYPTRCLYVIFTLLLFCCVPLNVCVFISWKEDILKCIILFPFSPSSTCRKPSQPSHSTAAARKILTENQELMQAGERLMQREIDEYHRQGFEEGASEQYKTPLSPTTHTLVLPDDSPNHQRETFV